MFRSKTQLSVLRAVGSALGQKMLRKHLGARNELAASVWLLEHGYEVYRNVSAHGLIDILAIKNGVVFKFDVKMCVGIRLLPAISEAQRELGVAVLAVFPDGSCEIVSNPRTLGDYGTVDCRHCGINFVRKKDRQVFCRLDCHKTYWKHRHQLRLAETRLKQKES
jgi:hypothetical protein